MPVGDWSTTPADNTEVGSVSIAEGMMPSGVNNAIREMMAELKTYLDGLGASGVDTANSPNANEFARFTDADTIEGRTVSETRSDLGLATTDNPQFATIELGAATDTTLSRSAAGKLAVEGIDVALLTGAQTLTGKTLTDPIITGAILEDIFTITDGAGFEIDPGNGTLQRVVLGASRTPAATNFANGESVTLMVDDGSAFTITWTTVGVVWVGGVAPTLATSGFSIIELWKEGNVIRGVSVGSTAS
jgi:hypothetical protein